MSTVEWSGVEQFVARLHEYRSKVKFAVTQVANYWAGVFEDDAKLNASWTDRTANARQTLHAFVEELSRDTVALYLSHGVKYGLYLEVRWGGRYAIIWPTIEKHLGEIRLMLQRIFR